MSRALAELPQIQFAGDPAHEGRFAAAQAAAALAHGPIYQRNARYGVEMGPFVDMVGPEANRFVFHTGRAHFSHDKGWTPLMGAALGKGLLNMDPPTHGRHRKMWNPAFTGPAIEAYLPMLERLIADRVRRWTQQDSIDVYHEARAITFAAAAWALAGIAPGPKLTELGRLFNLLGIHRRRDERVLAIIAERRARPQRTPPSDIIGMIVHARDEDGQPFSDQQILAHINILLVAGHETTSILSAWVLYLLAAQPEHRRRIQAELDEVVGNGSSPLTIEALRGMRQLDYLIKETCRLYPPVLNVPRVAISDFEFAGYTITAGTRIRLALGASHLLPSVFANPERFDPDRFAPPRAEDHRTPYGFVPFGGGVRICIGINFAHIEVKTLAVHVLRHCRLETVHSRPPVHRGALLAELDAVPLRVRPR